MKWIEIIWNEFIWNFTMPLEIKTEIGVEPKQKPSNTSRQFHYLVFLRSWPHRANFPSYYWHSLLFIPYYFALAFENRGLPKVRHDHKHRNSHAQNLRFPAIMVCNCLGYDISHYKNGSEIGEVWPSPHQYNVSRISHFLISATFHSTWENNTDMIDLDSNMSNHFNHSSDYSVCWLAACFWSFWRL